MFEAIDKMIKESHGDIKEDDGVTKLIKLFDSISEGDVPPQFAKFIKTKGGGTKGDDEKDDENNDDEKKDDKEEVKDEKEEVKKEAAELIAHFNKLSEEDQLRLAEDALGDWALCAMVEAEELTQDHKENKEGLRGAIGDANDGDKNKDDALPDTDDVEAKPETAKKLIDKSVSESTFRDWVVSLIKK